MSRAGKTAFAALCLAAVAAGCAPDTSLGRRLERQGQYPQAYESYCKALARNPGDSAAAAGLRRTVPYAVEYWHKRADQAAESGQWQLAGQCHLKALQIKPDDAASLSAARDIARRHGQELALARANPILPPPPEPGNGTNGSDARPSSTQHAPPKGAPRPPAAPPSTTAPTSAGAPTTAAVKPRPPAPAPNPTPPAPAPPARTNAGDKEPDFLATYTLSAKDKRYPRSVPLPEALSLNLRSIDRSPTTADVEVYVGDKKITRVKKLRPDSVLTVTLPGGSVYGLVVTDIDDRAETLSFGLRQIR